MVDVSVVIPVYNVKRYLEECVSSVIDQTWRNIEIILVDDGSTDESGRLCDEIAKKDSRIKVIHQKNRGQSSARNRGMSEATGEYILFVDSDDFIDSCLIEEIFGLGKEYDADIINFGSINTNGAKCIPKHFGVYDYEGFCANFYELEYSHAVWSKMYRRKFLTEHSIYFQELSGVEDACFNYQTWEAEFSRIIFQPKIYYHYRIRKDSTVHKYNHKLEADEYERVKQFHRLVEKISPKEEWEKRTYLCGMYAALYWMANLSYGKEEMPFNE